MEKEPRSASILLHAQRAHHHAKEDLEHAEKDLQHAIRDVTRALHDFRHARRDLAHLDKDLSAALAASVRLDMPLTINQLKEFVVSETAVRR